MSVQTYLEMIDRVIAEGPYKADWQSLAEHKTPEWYRRAKLGIFIHWGIYSVPGFGNEWYSRNMYAPDHREFKHHLETYGPHTQFGYKDFIPHFTGDKFDAEAWLALFKKAGARYIMPVAEHHDGFAMYKTQFNRWSAPNMGPKRDVIGELKTAAQACDIHFCASTHRAEHYFFMNMGRTFPSDVQDEAYADFYGPAVYSDEWNTDNLGQTSENPFTTGPSRAWLEDWMVRTCEFIDEYQPGVLYFDWWIQNFAFKPYLQKIAAYYYNRAAQWGREVSINYKREAFPPSVATFDVERGALTDISPVPWQTCTAIGKQSWGYCKDNSYKSSRQIICDLIDIVSKNGMLLLNVGPKADGSLTEEETKVLEELGAWMDICGEGIYDTVPWNRFGEGSVNAKEGFFQDGDEKAYTAEDFRFTYKGGCLYAFQLRSDGRDVCIRSLRKQGLYDFGIARVTLLGCSGAISWERTADGLQIRLPEGADAQMPLCFKINFL